MGIGIGIKIAIVAILFSIVSGGYFYIQALQGKLEAAAEVQQRMEGVITQQKAQMDRQDEDIQKMQEINSDISKNFLETQQEASDLRAKVNAPKLTAASIANAGNVQMKINRGTKSAFRCNEIATGSPLTKNEKSGTIKNTICPELISSLMPKGVAANAK